MLTDYYFYLFRELIYNLAGITLPESKRYFLETRIKEHLRELGISSLSDYLIMLVKDDNVFREFISKITVNETYFYREFFHLQALAYLVQTENLGKFIKVLSIPTSTGEEPYSIAIVLNEVLEGKPFSITGVDIDKNALAKAKRAVYGKRSVSKLPEQYLKKYFNIIDENTFELKPIIKRKVKFYEGNILDLKFLKSLGKFQYVFCKNLLIYFDKPGRIKAINNLYEIIVDGGYLFLGHAESLSGISSLFEPVKVKGHTVYRKVTEEDDEFL